MPFLLPNQQCQNTEGKNITFHGLAYPSSPGDKDITLPDIFKNRFYVTATAITIASTQMVLKVMTG